MICLALSICALSCGSFTWAVLTFPDGTMFLPLNSGSMKLCAEKKSAPQPRFGQIATSAFGTWQNFEQHRRVRDLAVAAA